jgi:hypothetical protein
MASSPKSPEKKIETFFFKDELERLKTENDKLDKNIRKTLKKPTRELPFFTSNVEKEPGLHLQPIQSTKLQLVLPSEPVDTSDPAINNEEFVLKNMRILLENEVMVLKVIHILCKIEDQLLYLLADKRNTLSDADIANFILGVKERLVILRDPVCQNLYEKFDSFYTEYKVILNYLRQNRAWPKST